MYTRFGSRRDLENVMEQIGEQIGNFIQQVGKEIPFAQRPQPQEPAQPEYQHTQKNTQTTGWPQIDVEEGDAGIYIYAELPGMDKSDIHITVGEDRTVVIRGEKKPVSRPGARRTAGERSLGAFSRSVALPEHADPATIQAEFTNGLLTVTIEKKEQNSGIRVEIR